MTPDEHNKERMRAWVRAAIRDTRLRADIPATELAALRDKARWWDAVASGKVRLVAAIDMRSVWWADYGTQPGKYTACTRNFHTAAEAVQAAIDAGALK